MKHPAACTLGLLLLLPSTAAPQTPKDEVDLGVILCHEDGHPARGPLDNNLVQALGRALMPAMDGNRSVGIRREPCSRRMPDASCFAGPRVLQCRASALERILRASAWLTSQSSLMGEIDYETFRRARPEAVRFAFAFADGHPPDPHLKKQITALLEGEAHANAGTETQGLSVLYQTIVDYNLAALIGHEVSHLFDETCPIDSPSHIETSGLFKSLTHQTLQGTLFCPRYPAVEEIRADRCALRHLKELHQSPFLGSDEGPVGELARRFASDMIAFQVLTGWRDLKIPQGKLLLRPLDQYLYSPYRLLAIIAELNATGRANRPAVCGEAAALFVKSVQLTFDQCRDGGGEVTDDLLALLPPGVEASWNGAEWTEDSYSCRGTSHSDQPQGEDQR